MWSLREENVQFKTVYDVPLRTYTLTHFMSKTSKLTCSCQNCFIAKCGVKRKNVESKRGKCGVKNVYIFYEQNIKINVQLPKLLQLYPPRLPTGASPLFAPGPHCRISVARPLLQSLKNSLNYTMKWLAWKIDSEMTYSVWRKN